jgi:hypothetical protein
MSLLATSTAIKYCTPIGIGNRATEFRKRGKALCFHFCEILFHDTIVVSHHIYTDILYMRLRAKVLMQLRLRRGDVTRTKFNKRVWTNLFVGMKFFKM